MNKKGVTLIELLVVIAIIGILSALGITALHEYKEKGQNCELLINEKCIE